MSWEDMLSKVRQLDNFVARWMLRHFYFLFFELVLVGLFFVFLLHIFRTLDLTSAETSASLTEKLLVQQNINTLIIIGLLFLNSFWMLYMFNGLERIRIILKDLSYSLTRRKPTN
jgi:hypothetical protein